MYDATCCRRSCDFGMPKHRSTSDVCVRGTIAAANVSTEGVGRTMIVGVQRSVAAQLKGISSLWVDAETGARDVQQTTLLLLLLQALP